MDKTGESHRYEDTGKEMAYLYTVARKLCVDAWRKLLRHKELWWSMVKYAAVILAKNMVCFR